MHQHMPVAENGWAEDKARRAEPVALTDLFHAAIPVLKHIDWRVTDTGRGYAETVLPLNVASSNQHIAHQAAVILIAADYTGGIALGTLLHGVPLVGIHPQQTDYGAYMWGAKAEITWIRPSIDDLVCTARIGPTQQQRVVRRFFGGRRVLESIDIEMRNGSELAAVATVTYWVQDTHALRRNCFDEDRVHILYDHRHKTSAKLIAGLRALEQQRPASQRLFSDEQAIELAGNHGLLLARRFTTVAPQLQPMVAARTKHLDMLLGSFHGGGPCQLVNIGAGLDNRTTRIALPEESSVFQLDLPLMLRKRQELVGMSPSREIHLPVDLRKDDVAAVVTASGAFRPDLPTLVVWEGGSMYFDAPTADRILRSASELLKNPTSRIWLDYVHPSVFDGSSDLPVVQGFTGAMQCLGEPFVNGYSDLPDYLRQQGLEAEQDTSSSIYMGGGDPVYDLYRFCVARRAST